MSLLQTTRLLRDSLPLLANFAFCSALNTSAEQLAIPPLISATYKICGAKRRPAKRLIKLPMMQT